MVQIETPRKRTAILFITILILALHGTSADAASTVVPTKKATGPAVVTKKASTTTVVSKKTTTTTKKVATPITKKKVVVPVKKTQVKGETTSATRAKQLPTDAGLLTQYTVVSGDTISGIAENFSVSQNDILDLNGLSKSNRLHIGMILSIPVNTPIAPAPAPTPITVPIIPVTTPVTNSTPVVTTVIPITNTPIVTTQSASVSPVTVNTTSLLRGGYYTQPIAGILTQGIHDINAVDFGADIGTDVHAAAAGTIFIVKNDSGYNGGYGNYIVINHPNGTQTLYAHLSQINVHLGDSVAQGQLIALSGNTGRTTGPHLHLEVRGAMNPWGSDALGTHYTL